MCEERNAYYPNPPTDKQCKCHILADYRRREDAIRKAGEDFINTIISNIPNTIEREMAIKQTRMAISVAKAGIDLSGGDIDNLDLLLKNPKSTIPLKKDVDATIFHHRV